MGDLHHLPRAKPRLIRPAPDHIQRQADLDDWLANRRKPEPSRAAVWSRRIGVFAVVLVAFMAVYLLFQMGRGVL